MTEPTFPLAGHPEEAILPMPGLEVDSLLAQLASWGLLRALEEARPAWRARLSWQGPPWCAQLHLAEAAEEEDVAAAANEGVLALVQGFDVGENRNVSFTRETYREHLAGVLDEDTAWQLAAAMTSECPERNNGTLVPSPFVLMFGQGHQNFLERLVAIPRGDLPKRLQKRRHPPDLAGPANLAEALFDRWRREDETDSFRWDPTEDQRYALRFDDPSKAGAAATVHGANRLAAIGFTCLAAAPRRDHPGVPAFRRSRRSVEFVWPVWDVPLSLAGVLALLGHPAVVEGRMAEVRSLGVREIYRARRIANGKFMNVTWANPVADSSEADGTASKRKRRVG